MGFMFYTQNNLEQELLFTVTSLIKIAAERALLRVLFLECFLDRFSTYSAALIVTLTCQ